MSRPKVTVPTAALVVPFVLICAGAITVPFAWPIGLSACLGGFAFMVVYTLHWRSRVATRLGPPPWDVEFPRWTLRMARGYVAVLAASTAGLLLVLILAAALSK